MLVVGCDHASPPPARGKVLRRVDFGDNWPLTVDSILVDCISGISAVGYNDGHTYALNGLAQSRGYEAVEPIWRFNPELPGWRMLISPVADSARLLCER